MLFPIVVLLSFAVKTNSYSNGPPPGVCGSMAPSVANVTGHGAQPQTVASPYTVTVDNIGDGYVANTTYTITIGKKSSATDDIEGFFCQVRDSAGSSTAQVGTFVDLIPFLHKNVACAVTPLGSVSHMVELHNASVVVSWQAPATVSGELKAFCTIVQHKPTYWVKVESDAFSSAEAMKASFAVVISLALMLKALM
eukprot:m.306184 g.306184  ORF g.306184 m.306184 type:complete len:196 (+) comp41029_c0_seq1:65-652(+)